MNLLVPYVFQLSVGDICFCADADCAYILNGKIICCGCAAKLASLLNYFLVWKFLFSGRDTNSNFFVGVQLLMEMLFERSSSGNSAEVTACERVQQKSAVTLARLSRDPEVAHAAIKLSCKNLMLTQWQTVKYGENEFRLRLGQQRLLLVQQGERLSDITC